MSRLLQVDSIAMDTTPSRSVTSSDMGTRIGREDFLASIFFHCWKECSCIPLCPQFLAEEKQYFPLRQKHCHRFCSFYYLPWILSSMQRSITSFGCLNSSLQDCNLGQQSRLPIPSRRGCSLRAQSLLHFWKGKEPSGRLTDRVTMF